MNERIKQLAEQAELARELVDQRKYDTYTEYQQSLNDHSYIKFAQLIVEECAAIALKSGNINNKSMQAKVEAERIYHKIKEHFGVEE
jgi:hypothetical protein